MRMPFRESTDRIHEAALWLASRPQPPPRPLVPILKREFGLSAAEAVAAIRRANAIKADGR